jgi:hypothetical protein
MTIQFAPASIASRAHIGVRFWISRLVLRSPNAASHSCPDSGQSLAKTRQLKEAKQTSPALTAFHGESRQTFDLLRHRGRTRLTLESSFPVKAGLAPSTPEREAPGGRVVSGGFLRGFLGGFHHGGTPAVVNGQHLNIQPHGAGHRHGDGVRDIMKLKDPGTRQNPWRECGRQSQGPAISAVKPSLCAPPIFKSAHGREATCSTREMALFGQTKRPMRQWIGFGTGGRSDDRLAKTYKLKKIRRNAGPSLPLGLRAAKEFQSRNRHAASAFTSCHGSAIVSGKKKKSG